MRSRVPRVGIGLPVYNGEDFLRQAIESILGQTFGDFDLVISDNASTDGTEEICREYADRDERVAYHRNPENIGSAGNYTRTFELTRGEYFKWVAHDDVCLPTFVERCVEVLDRDPSVVLSYARTRTIDSRGRPGKEWPSRPAAGAPSPEVRLEEGLLRNDTFPIWGVMRRQVLATTPLLGPYPAHDRPLLAEMSLRGRFHEIDEFLFLEREHPGRSVRAYDPRDPHEAIVWYDPTQKGKLIFPTWRLLKEYRASVRRVPLRVGSRARCYAALARWMRTHRAELIHDLQVAGARGRVIGPLFARGVQRARERSWRQRAGRAARDLQRLVPAEEALVLLDEALFDSSIFARWETIPFPQRGGVYAGPPVDDRMAIDELERLRSSDARFLAIAWPAFWWLDHYAELHAHVSERFRCLLRNERVILFDMGSAPGPMGGGA